MIWLMINIILSLLASYIIYNLSLSFLGIFVSVKKSIIQMLIFSSLIFISKLILHTSAVTHTIVLVIVCTLLITLFNKVSLLLSTTSTLLVLIIIMLGSMLIICPLFSQLGISLNLDFKTLDWVIINIGELFIPGTIFLINRKYRNLFIEFLFIDRR